MKEYRDVRDKVAFKDLCRRPELAAEFAVTAQKKLGVDAGIVFSDILLILEAMGAGLEYAEGKGPVISKGVAAPADVERLNAAEPEALQFVYDAVRQTRAALPPNVPLIGFSGAPFTLAAYLIDGHGARESEKTRMFMRQHPGAWDALLGKLVKGLTGCLWRQAASGAQVLQVFDTWVGVLGPRDYRQHVLPHMRTLIAELPPGVPTIYFGTGTAGILDAMVECEPEVIGVDSRSDLGAAWARCGAVGIQGNLDPTVLFSDASTIRRAAQNVLDSAAGRPGHVFNLGHGVMPGTPVDNVRLLVDTVHEASSRM
jgi:uroporphyrinogen decarboxylase